MATIRQVLRGSLTQLDLGGFSNTHISARIFTEVDGVLTEAKLGKIFRQLGNVDFAVTRDDVVVLVIRIVHSNERFSLTELEHFRDQGDEAILVRWGKPTCMQVPDGVDLVDIPVPLKSNQEPTSKTRHLAWTPEPATRRVPKTSQWILSTYPRAYQRWTEEGDLALLFSRSGGETIQALSITHHRQPSAIKSRLRKLDTTDSLHDPGNAAFGAAELSPNAKGSSPEILLMPPRTSQSESIPDIERMMNLLDESKHAWVDMDWERLSSLSRTVLELAHYGVVPDESIVLAGQWHLGAMMSSGKLLDYDREPARSVTARLVTEFATWVESQSALPPLLSEYIAVASEIVARAEEESIMVRGQMASWLRKVLRPDLAIQVTDTILESSRLNYYATATRGAALCDLGHYDEAISTLKVSLAAYRPVEGVGRVLNALSRAHRLRFTQEGDLNDGEVALLCAQAAWEVSPDQHAANTYLAAAAASLDSEAIKLAKECIQQMPSTKPDVDRATYDRVIARLSLR